MNGINNQYFSGYRGLGGCDRGLVGVYRCVTRASKKESMSHNGFSINVH